MRYLKFIGICALFLASLFAAYACSDSPTDPAKENTEIPNDVMQIAQDHSMPFAPVAGGISKFTPSNTIYDPPFENYDLYSVTLLWGSLYNHFNNSTTPPSALLDWSGHAVINGVAVIDVVYEIDFEAQQDSVIPANNPAQAAWVSQAGDLDGISMLVYLDRDITYITAPTFSIETGQIELNFQFSELENHAHLYPVSNTQAMVVVAKRILSVACPHGTMIGEWIRDDVGGSSGYLHGTWYENANNPAGLFSGQFEISNSGVGTFSGSVSGYVTDEVIYQFHGSWFYDDPRECAICGSGHGRYRGLFYDFNGHVVGLMKGEFGYAPDVTDNHLPLTGNWREFCNDVSLTDNTQ
jgi:hypothetical protein